jgi:hypothetical protein
MTNSKNCRASVGGGAATTKIREEDGDGAEEQLAEIA